MLKAIFNDPDFTGMTINYKGGKRTRIQKDGETFTIFRTSSSGNTNILQDVSLGEALGYLEPENLNNTNRGNTHTGRLKPFNRGDSGV